MIQRRIIPRHKALWKQVREQLDGPEPEKPKKFIVLHPNAKPLNPWIGYWPRNKIRHVSKRKARIGKLYLIVRNAHLIQNPIDNGDCKSKATEIHHQRGRAGTLYLDWRFFISVSRETHNWISNNIKAARERLLICQPGFWGQAPNDEITKGLASIMAEPSFARAKIQLENLSISYGLKTPWL